MVGVAWLNSIGSGSTTSISDMARPASIVGSSAIALRPCLEPDALTALAGVVQLEQVVLGDDLLGHRDRIGAARPAGRGIGAPLALQEIKRHAWLPGSMAGAAAIVAGRRGRPGGYRP